MIVSYDCLFNVTKVNHFSDNANLCETIYWKSLSYSHIQYYTGSSDKPLEEKNLSARYAKLNTTVCGKSHTVHVRNQVKICSVHEQP